MPKPQPTNYSNSWLRTKASTTYFVIQKSQMTVNFVQKSRRDLAVPHARDD
ncbi:hypothetical protein [Rubritalea tangerina]|uniref:hypothetical protein n=1 Tax=Rubritalea tangerina TaxID=430798 RepID=UPI0036224EBE